MTTTTVGQDPVDETAELELAAADVATRKMTSDAIDYDVESPVDLENHLPAKDSVSSTRPFASDAANNYYYAMTTRSILKKTKKKGEKKGIMSKINWKKGGGKRGKKSDEEEGKKIDKEVGKEDEADKASDNSRGKTDEGLKQLVSGNLSISKDKSDCGYSALDNGAGDGDNVSPLESNGKLAVTRNNSIDSDTPFVSSNSKSKKSKKGKKVKKGKKNTKSGDTSHKDDNKSSDDDGIKLKDVKALNGLKSTEDNSGNTVSSNASSKASSNASSNASSKASGKADRKSKSKSANNSVGSNSENTTRKNGNDHGAKSSDGKNKPEISSVSEDSSNKILGQLVSNALPVYNSSNSVSGKSPKEAVSLKPIASKSSSKDGRSASLEKEGSTAVASRKSLEKMFSEALANSKTPEEAARFLQASDRAFQFLQAKDSVTKKRIIQRKDIVNNDLEEGEVGNHRPSEVPPITSFERLDALSTTSSVTENSYNKSISSRIKRNLSTVSNVTEVVKRGNKNNSNGNAAIDEHVANPDKAVLSEDDEGDKAKSSDASTAASSNPSSAEEGRIKGGDDDGSTVSTASGKSKRSRLKHFAARLLNIPDDAEEAKKVTECLVCAFDEVAKSETKGSGSDLSAAAPSATKAANEDGDAEVPSLSRDLSKEDTPKDVSAGIQGVDEDPSCVASKLDDASKDMSIVSNGSNTSTGSNTTPEEVNMKISANNCSCGMDPNGMTQELMSEFKDVSDGFKTSVKKLFGVFPTLSICATGEVEMSLGDRQITSFEAPLLQGISSSSSDLTNQSNYDSYITNSYDDSGVLSWKDLQE